MKHSGKIGKFLHDYLYQCTDELDELYTKLLTETLLYRTITMDTALRTLLWIVVPTLTSTKEGN